MRFVALLLLLSLAAIAMTQADKDRDQRMKWWREARLGMFIHWGLYAIPAGKWGDRTDHAEWIRDTAHIPVHEYEKLLAKFNPVKFNAEKWVEMAKAAGMKYIVITTKHHDGFDLFATKEGDWNVMHTPFHRDIMKEMADACHRNGIQICWYHSIMDWHEPDYLPRRGWEVADRPADGADFNRYVDYLRAQVTELLTNYGHIGVMWFDGEWESTWNDTYGRPLYELCRKLQPSVIVNNRVSNNRAGSMEAVVPKDREVGDFSTPEQFIPPTGLPGVDWETCMTMNDHWGYNAYDKDWKSSKALIRNIVDIASKGGNYLLNIGPMADGEFPPEAVSRLKDIGAWMKVNGDAIYGTAASVFDDLPWGRSTTKRDGDKTELYLHVFDWPSDGRLVVPSIGNDPEGATLLATWAKLPVLRQGSDLVVQLPAKAPSEISSTVVLTIDGAPVIYHTPKIAVSSPILLSRATVTIDAGSPGIDIHYTLDGSEPTTESPLYSDPIAVADTLTVRAASFAHGKRVSTVSSLIVQKVVPNAAVTDVNVKSGLRCKEYKGGWTQMPDFDRLTPRSAFDAGVLSVPMVHNLPEEHVGRVYAGYILVPADDVYQFTLTSDDGSRLYVDGKLLIDNDGLHSAQAKTGDVALAEGLHAVRIEWYNATGDAVLHLGLGRVGEDGKVSEVPVVYKMAGI